jgi:hypothetical protein
VDEAYKQIKTLDQSTSAAEVMDFNFLQADVQDTFVVSAGTGTNTIRAQAHGSFEADGDKTRLHAEITVPTRLWLLVVGALSLGTLALLIVLISNHPAMWLSAALMLWCYGFALYTEQRMSQKRLAYILLDALYQYPKLPKGGLFKSSHQLAFTAFLSLVLVLVLSLLGGTLPLFAGPGFMVMIIVLIVSVKLGFPLFGY